MVRHCLYRAKKPPLFIFHVPVSEKSLNRCHLCNPTTWAKNKPLWVTHECIHVHTHTAVMLRQNLSTVLHSRCVGFSGTSVLLQAYTDRWKSSNAFFPHFFSPVLLHSTESFLLYMVSKKEPPKIDVVSACYSWWLTWTSTNTIEHL